MQLFLIQFDISVPFAAWEEGFIDHQPVRESAGIEDVFRGQVADSNRIMIGLKAESQTVLDELMEAEAANIEATGHVLDSTEILVVDVSSD